MQTPWHASVGSPPRAWGGLPHGPALTNRGRLTPTCVGRTGRDRPDAKRRQAHPHVRGEDGVLTEAEGRHLGSPPRAWGGPAFDRYEPVQKRLTPTCVGRTATTAPTRRRQPAHPHVRGEDRWWLRRRAPYAGSPPRAWGGRHRVDPPHPRQRLTPTCVGRTAMRRAATSAASAHPHVRGEDEETFELLRMLDGSPPRAWGGLPSSGASWASVRLTPTCVGRTPRDRHGRAP